MASFISKIVNKNKCNSRVTATDTTVLTDAGTYYQVEGTFSNGDCVGFTVDAEGTITYSGPPRVFQFVGFSDLEVDKACTITYALELNSVIDTATTTPHTFTAASKIDNIGITRVVSLSTGDVLKVKAKSDTAATTMTASTLYLTFMEE